MNETAMMESIKPAQTARSQALSIPLDLTEWAPVDQLRDWIVANVATLDWTNAEIVELLQTHPDFQPRALLNTVVFAYAVGIFGAEEIARSCSTNPDFRTLRPRLPPIVSDLKQFRRGNRGILKWALADVISRALKSQLIEGPSLEALPMGLRRYMLDNARARLDLARHIDSREDVM
jgi:hypothetical protein